MIFPCEQVVGAARRAPVPLGTALLTYEEVGRGWSFVHLSVSHASEHVTSLELKHALDTCDSGTLRCLQASHTSSSAAERQSYKSMRPTWLSRTGRDKTIIAEALSALFIGL